MNATVRPGFGPGVGGGPVGRALSPVGRLPSVLLLPVLLLAGCVFVEKPTLPGSAEYAAASRQGAYRILAGDELEIRFFHTPDHNVTLPVRPDGYISLPYAREVLAAGKTPDELTEELTRRYSVELRDPEIAVVCRSFSAHKIHVGGRVEAPGVLPLTGSMTVLQSLFAAGGTTPEARLSEVVVIRRSPDSSYLVIPIDIKAILDGSDVTQNIELMPYDAVYVPDSPIAEVNTWVDQYLRKNIPINFSVRPEPF